MATTTTALSWHHTVHTRPRLHRRRTYTPPIHPRRVAPVRAFQRSDFDGFAKRMASGEALRDAWRSANDGFELLLFDAKKTAERIDRRYSVSRRVASAATTAMERARGIDRELGIGARWRTFSMDFRRNWPRYRNQFNKFLDTPLGRSAAAVFFLWFALSGWLLWVLIIATWVLPIAGPLLIGTLANNLVIKGACPACKRQFVGNKSQMIRCAGCGNIVWEPQGDFFSRGGGSKASRKSDPQIIDVEFEEK